MTTNEAPTYPIDRVLGRIATRPDALARLRRDVGRPLEESPGSWPYVMEAAGGRRAWELPAHVTLGLFALHQQSQQPGSMNVAEWGLGRACGSLRQQRFRRGLSEDGVDRRFRAALAADSLVALSVHLRGLVTLLRGDGIGLGYRKLFFDLAAWESPSKRDRVALTWARSYFNTFSDDQEEHS